MAGWSIKRYPTVCSFGVKLLLLAGTMGVLSFAGFLERPSSSAPSDVLATRQIDTPTGHLPKSPAVAVADIGQVDINHGTAEELRRLPGIGPVLAERIVRHRQEHGTFGAIRDIQDVKGIAAKKFAQLEPYVHIDGKALSSDE